MELLSADDRSPQALLKYNRFYYREAFDPASDYDLIVTSNPISPSIGSLSIVEISLDLIDLIIFTR